MSQNPLFPYADVPGFETLQIINDAAQVQAMSDIVAGMDKSQLENLYVSEKKIGTALLFTAGDLVLEMVLSKFDGTLSTLYRKHPMFENRHEWLQTRLVLIETVNDIAESQHDGSLRSTAAINEFGAALFCKIRGKSVRVHALGTAQLLDVIKANKAHAILAQQISGPLH